MINFVQLIIISAKFNSRNGIYCASYFKRHIKVACVAVFIMFPPKEKKLLESIVYNTPRIS